MYRTVRNAKNYVVAQWRRGLPSGIGFACGAMGREIESRLSNIPTYIGW
jgi:hypothetical protein